MIPTGKRESDIELLARLLGFIQHVLLRFSLPLDGCLRFEFLDLFVFPGGFLFEVVDSTRNDWL
ncbi:hypothetical protein [Haladaptatus sp. CMAA 1911]|uniref:hypothetical protein n=1 Tax=unclassified Haladaptatus TaxID=2622732 RepID=UPI003754C87A